MKCVKCKAKAGKIALISGELVCSDCFCVVIEKRVRSFLRKNNILFKQSKILFLTDDSTKSEFFLLFAQTIADTTRTKVLFRKMKVSEKIFSDKLLQAYAKRNKVSEVFIPWSADDEAEFLVSKFFGKKHLNNLGAIVKLGKISFVKPLMCASEKEISAYVEIKTGKKKECGKKSAVGQMITDLEKQYPGRIFGTVSSSDELSGVISKKHQ